MQPTPPRGEAETGYAADRGRAGATQEPERERAEAQRAASDHEAELEPPRGVRVPGWPWALAIVVALGFFAWFVYAVWFS